LKGDSTWKGGELDVTMGEPLNSTRKTAEQTLQERNEATDRRLARRQVTAEVIDLAMGEYGMPKNTEDRV